MDGLSDRRRGSCAARQERIGRIIVARRQGLSLRAIALHEHVSERQIRFDLKLANAEGPTVLWSRRPRREAATGRACGYGTK